MLALASSLTASPEQCGGTGQPSCLNSLSLPMGLCVADGWTIDNPTSSEPLRIAGVSDQGFGASHLNRFAGVDMFITHVALQAQRPTAGQTTAILRIWFGDNTLFGDLRPSFVVDTAIVNLPSSFLSTDYTVVDLDTTINTSGFTFWVELFFPTAGGVCMGTREKNVPGQQGESFVVSHEANPATESWVDYELVSPDPGAAYNMRAPVLRPLQLTACARNCYVSVGGFEFETNEDGDSVILECGITDPPTDTVFVDIVSTDPSEGVPSVSQLVFTPIDWNFPRKFKVFGQDDALIDGDIWYNIQAIASSNDTCYDGEFHHFSCLNYDNDLGFMPTVPVGYPGNPPDVNGDGQVLYEYKIGENEVTNDEYIAFLGAVGQADNVGLYNSLMGTDPRGGILRTGPFGAYTYAARPNMGNKPVNFVSQYDAMRFCNWLHNGQPTGGLDPTTTEDGSYNMSVTIGGVTIRKSDATWVIQNTPEWYKAAFYDPVNPGADANGSPDYWSSTAMADLPPLVAFADAIGDVLNHDPNVVNHNNGAVWNGVTGNVTTCGSIGPQASTYFGTNDQGGNVTEWTDEQFVVGMTTFGLLLGRNCTSATPPMSSSYSDGSATATSESEFIGFRVVDLRSQGLCGDADGSGGVDIDDVVFLIAYIFQSGPAPSPLSSGDANCSGAIDIDDVVYLIAYIFAGGPPPCDTNNDGLPDC